MIAGKTRYSRESLAATLGVPPRRITHWVERGLLSRAHNSPGRYGNKGAYYDESHVREGRAIIAVQENNAPLTQVGAFLREVGMTITDYTRERGIEVRL